MGVPAPFHTLSLCAGVGGLDVGLRLAVETARTVVYCEREAAAVAVLVRRMEDGCLDPAPVWSDLGTFDGRPWRPVVDCVIGSYPCQGESTAGKGLGVKDPRWLWPQFARIIGEVRPAFVFCENVGAHLSRSFSVVARDLDSLGYRIAAGVFTAAEVGAAHKRERLFVMGVAHDERWRQKPKTKPREGSKQDAAGKSFRAVGTVGDSSLVGYDGRNGRQGGQISGKRETEESGRAPVGEPFQSGLERLAHEPTNGRPFADRGWGPAAPPGSTGPAGGTGLGRAGDRGHDGLFAPGPGAVEWVAVLEHRPEFAPALENAARHRQPGGDGERRRGERVSEAGPPYDGGSAAERPVCRVADGPAAELDFGDRIDRLRALGNMVVPLQGAFAFVTLARALGLWDNHFWTLKGLADA